MWLLAVLLFTIVPSVTSQFFSPTQRREVWRIGDTKTVGYNTKLTNYTIALWQQALVGGSANLGPVIVVVDDGPKKEFEWQVDTYNLDLGASNVFFFWLVEGDNSIQGNQKAKSMSSAYFNITDEPAPSSSSAAPPKSTTEAAQTTNLSAPSETAPASTSGGVGVSTNMPTNQDTSNSEPSGGLPGGAQIGIGVGVGVVAVTCIVCGVLWFRYLKKQQRALAELQERAFSQRAPAPPYSELTATGLREQIQKDGGYFVNKRPVEMD